ncbi:hypothetical protein GGR57DRAFT_107107 [Xylariaceae sp. FL1272]|nr:hypothetical protein GGR57DRAFT_107107 [Xylariaceae sp. FL1272]
MGTMSAILPPVEKLPLATRKSVRDDWDAKKEDVEKKLSEMLETPWTISVNPNQVFAYAKSDYPKQNLGNCIHEYFDSSTRRLQEYIDKYGDEGVKEVNTIVHAHVMTLDVDDGKRFSYSGADIQDGQIRLLFHPENLGSNISSALSMEYLLDALNKAKDPESRPISFAARLSIREGYDRKIKEVEDKIAELLGKPLNLVPNFESNFAVLKEESQKKKTDLRKDWESSFGQAIHDYFYGLSRQLEWQKFEDDELLQEGFFEIVEKAEVQFRIVEKLKERSYNEVVIEDGVLYIQTIPSRWWSNSSDAAEGLVNML